jgi:hypothetical protein
MTFFLHIILKISEIIFALQYFLLSSSFIVSFFCEIEMFVFEFGNVENYTRFSFQTCNETMFVFIISLFFILHS